MKYNLFLCFDHCKDPNLIKYKQYNIIYNHKNKCWEML